VNETESLVVRHKLDPSHFFGREVYSDTHKRLDWDSVYELGSAILGPIWLTKTELPVGLQTTLSYLLTLSLIFFCFFVQAVCNKTWESLTN
jgi:hypothetical protein